LTKIVPGIRPAGAPRHDQGRAATPREAYDAGADILVIGRPVTAVDDRVAAARAIHQELAR
jgi:orotidine-5'-phosphate decarboxylase